MSRGSRLGFVVEKVCRRTFGLEWRGLPPGLVGRDHGLAVGGQAGGQRGLVRLLGHAGENKLIRRLRNQINEGRT